MKTEKCKLKAQQEQLDIPVVCALHEQQCTIPHVQNKSEKCKFILS